MEKGSLNRVLRLCHEVWKTNREVADSVARTTDSCSTEQAFNLTAVRTTDLVVTVAITAELQAVAGNL